MKVNKKISHSPLATRYSSLRGGFVAVSTVLVVMAIVLVVTVTVTYLSIGEMQGSWALTQSESNLNLSESCLEKGLMALQASGSYAGGSIVLPEATCNITVTSVSNTYTLTATTTATNYIRTVQAVVTRGSNLALTSWNEL
jgi:hypothetical protein